MFAITQVKKFIDTHPSDPQVSILSDLVAALQSDAQFPLSKLYDLGAENFRLALQVLEDWRLDRHYAKERNLLGSA